MTPRRFPPAGRDASGFALPAALAVLLLLSVLVVAVYANAMAAFRSGTTDLGKTRAYYAAEAGAESALAQLADALEDAALQDQDLEVITAPTMADFVFDSFSVVKVGGVVPERITDGPFTGLYALTQMVDVYSEASDPARNSSAVMVSARARAIPIFQFGVFYEEDLEILNGPRLDFAGWVHSNGNIYLNSNNQYFQDLVTTPNKVFHDRKDSHAVNPGVWIRDASGADVRLNFDSRDTPDPNDFRAASDRDFDNRLQTDAYDVDALRVPLPTGVSAEAVIEPREPTDGQLEMRAKMAWKADWYIEIPMDAISDPAELCDQTISIRDDPTHVLPTAPECRNIFSLRYDAWYEGRERRYVDVLDVDLARLFAWTGNDAARITNILYVFLTGTSPDPRGDGDYPIVRVRNGATLRNPITIATVHPLYVMGNYNAGFWQPSALMGDAITLLSNAWNDADHTRGAVVRPNASSTRYNAAILAGHSPTPCDHEMPGCGATSPYGGGLENFPRFLETWTGRTVTYRGSLVSLHVSSQATAPWSYGGYYTAPDRDWAFDTRFEDPTNLPPGTPAVGNVVHTAFRPIY